jgi:hypothetical protein
MDSKIAGSAGIGLLGNKIRRYISIAIAKEQAKKSGVGHGRVWAPLPSDFREDKPGRSVRRNLGRFAVR